MRRLTGRRELWGGSQATPVRGEKARLGVGATPWNIPLNLWHQLSYSSKGNERRTGLIIGLKKPTSDRGKDTTSWKL
jgi:hypothetical protein